MKLLRISIIIIISYIAISLSITRIIIADANRYTTELENLLEENYKVKIDIESISGNWKGVYPSIKVNINNDRIYKGIKLPKTVVLDFNIYKSIFLFKPIINSLYAKNIYYKSSYNKLISVIKSRSNNKIPQIHNIHILNSEFKINDSKNIYHLKKTNISIIKNNISLRAEIDNNKIFLVDINNIDFKNKSSINLKYKLQVSGNFDYNFKNILNKYNLEIKKSDLRLIAKGSYRDNKFINNIVTLETTNISNITINKKVLSNLQFDIIFNQKLENSLNFEINKLGFFVNNNSYNLKNIAGNLENNIYSFYIYDLNFNYKNIIADFNINIEKMNDVNFNGSVKNLNLSFNKEDFFKSFYVKGDFYNTNIIYKHRKISNFSGFIESDYNSSFINFNSKDILLSDKEIIRKDRNFNSVTGFLNVLNYSNPTIHFSSLRLINKEIDISFDGFVNQNVNRIKLFSNIKFLDMRYVTDYMPISIISKESARWFSNAFKNGFTQNGNILIDGGLINYPFYDDYSGNSYGIFPISKLHVDYKRDWIPFKNIKGNAYFSNNNAMFIAKNFKILKTDFKNGKLLINDVRNTDLIINGDLNGPLNDLLKYSNKAKLTNISNKKISNIEGNSETNFKINLSFKGKNNIYESQIKLNNISYKFDKNKKIKSINGIIKFKDGKFYTGKDSFIKAKYINNDVKFKLKTNKDNDFVISGIHYLNYRKITDKKNILENITGKSLWKYNITLPGFNNKKSIININAKSNLVGTKINYPKPFKKNKSEKKLTLINITLKDSDFKSYKILYNGILSEFKPGNNLNGYINFSGKKSTIPENRFNIIGFLDEFNLNSWKDFSSDPDSIDYLSFLNSVNISFGTFKNNDIILDNFIINGYRSNNNFVFKKLEASSDFVTILSSGSVEFGNNSNFKINLNSNNVEELLNYWKIKHSLRDSSINGTSEITWKGGIFDFSIKDLYGKFTINMKDGRLKKVGNRATRIFGLFNIDLLVKRLSLDFDDVTKNGFFFSSMNGDFRLNNGNIFTTNLIVKGPSAELLTVGRTDIINETYDMQVVASPEFGEALPAIALLGGPITAAATYAAEKLAKAFGKNINDLIKIKYSVSGSWDEPIIKVIDKSTSPLENIEDLFK
jgi:uncharacterized protein YhdP